MAFKFSITIDVDTKSPDTSRHLAHHRYLLLFQKARQDYLAQFGYSERDIEGFGIFVVEANCIYRRELFHRETVDVRCRVDDIKNKVFAMTYSIERDGTVCAQGFTKAVCADPVTRKAVPLPEAFVSTIRRYEGLD